MGRLIPLRLQGSTDTTRSSISSPSTPTVLPSFPAKFIDRPRPSPVTNLTIFPSTEREWRDVMEEVKILYVRKQYKRCSARCIQIVDSIKDSYRVHPLYQIYVYFFTASSLELTSRSLHLNSSTKLPLLQQSLTYYQHAESHMEYASFSVDPTIVSAVRQTRRNSLCSSSSSIRSSVDSIFSRCSSRSSSRSSTSAIASASPSPTFSCYSTPSDLTPTIRKRVLSAPLSPAPLKIRKKVSFSLQLPRILSEAELEAADDATLIDAFPYPPSKLDGPPSPMDESSISEFLLSRALIRYRGHLSDLQGQIKYHIKSVESQINTVHQSRKAWRSNLPNLFTDFGNVVDGVDEEDSRKVELRARIEKLKADGWKRERFDGSRYQALCEKAMVELE